MEEDNLKFPIGKLNFPEEISEENIKEAITILQIFPEKIKSLTYNLKDEVLDQSYRPGSWTIRQLIHHIADSHHHSYNRFRWALTEDNPLIKAYDQAAFAEMSDYKTAPISWSIAHIEAVHQKLVYMLESFTTEQWERTLKHPERENEMDMKQLALMYSWHSMHHFAHIKNALDRM